MLLCCRSSWFSSFPPPFWKGFFSILFLSLADKVESQAINMVLLRGLQLNKYLWCTEVLLSILLVCSGEKAWNPWGDPWSALLCRAKAVLCIPCASSQQEVKQIGASQSTLKLMVLVYSKSIHLTGLSLDQLIPENGFRHLHWCQIRGAK